MPSPLFRTYRTSLTDDELILLDVLFKWRISFEALRRDDFALAFNCDPHDLDDVQLVETLARFCETGYLRRSPPFDHRVKKYGGWFEMTARGGELWQSERQPVWELFVSCRERPMLSGRTIVSRNGMSVSVCTDSLQLYWEYFGQGRRLSRIRQFQSTRYEILSWKSFATIHLVAGVSDGDPSFEEYVRRDWKLYETLRTSWSTVQELQKFVGPGRVD